MHGWVNGRLGWFAEDEESRIAPEKIALKAARGGPRGTVPAKASILVSSADTQKLGWWWRTRAWSRDSESWLVGWGFARTFTSQSSGQRHSSGAGPSRGRRRSERDGRTVFTWVPISAGAANHLWDAAERSRPAAVVDPASPVPLLRLGQRPPDERLSLRPDALRRVPSLRRPGDVRLDAVQVVSAG